MENDFEYHNVVDIFLFNSNGELALQKRAVGDKSFPDHWDFSAGGHIDAGETPDVAAKREAKEELGILINPIYVADVELKYKAWKSSVTRKVDVHVFKVVFDNNFIIDKKEVQKIEFFDLKTIQNMLDNGDKFHPEFVSIWKNKLLMDKILSK